MKCPKCQFENREGGGICLKRRSGTLIFITRSMAKAILVVMITGLANSTEYYFRLVPGLAEKYRVIIFDNRGAGQSDKPDIPYTMDMLTDDAAGLLDALGVDRAHIYGHSMGGAIAQHLALRYPEKTASLVLACTSCGGRHGVPPDQEYIAYLTDMQRRSQETREETIKRGLHFYFSPDFVHNNPDIIQHFISSYVKHAPPIHSYNRQIEAVMTHDIYDRLPEIKVPTLVVAGGADTLTPTENSRILASRIPKAELMIMEDMRHFLIVEAPEELNKAIIDFLERVG